MRNSVCTRSYCSSAHRPTRRFRRNKIFLCHLLFACSKCLNARKTIYFDKNKTTHSVEKKKKWSTLFIFINIRRRMHSFLFVFYSSSKTLWRINWQLTFRRVNLWSASNNTYGVRSPGPEWELDSGLEITILSGYLPMLFVPLRRTFVWIADSVLATRTADTCNVRLYLYAQ